MREDEDAIISKFRKTLKKFSHGNTRLEAISKQLLELVTESARASTSQKENSDSDISNGADFTSLLLQEYSAHVESSDVPDDYARSELKFPMGLSLHQLERLHQDVADIVKVTSGKGSIDSPKSPVANKRFPPKDKVPASRLTKEDRAAVVLQKNFRQFNKAKMAREARREKAVRIIQKYVRRWRARRRARLKKQKLIEQRLKITLENKARKLARRKEMTHDHAVLLIQQWIRRWRIKRRALSKEKLAQQRAMLKRTEERLRNARARREKVEQGAVNLIAGFAQRMRVRFKRSKYERWSPRKMYGLYKGDHWDGRFQFWSKKRKPHRGKGWRRRLKSELEDELERLRRRLGEVDENSEEGKRLLEEMRALQNLIRGLEDDINEEGSGDSDGGEDVGDHAHDSEDDMKMGTVASARSTGRDSAFLGDITTRIASSVGVSRDITRGCLSARDMVSEEEIGRLQDMLSRLDSSSDEAARIRGILQALDGSSGDKVKEEDPGDIEKLLSADGKLDGNKISRFFDHWGIDANSQAAMDALKTLEKLGDIKGSAARLKAKVTSQRGVNLLILGQETMVIDAVVAVAEAESLEHVKKLSDLAAQADAQADVDIENSNDGPESERPEIELIAEETGERPTTTTNHPDAHPIDEERAISKQNSQDSLTSEANANGQDLTTTQAESGDMVRSGGGLDLFVAAFSEELLRPTLKVAFRPEEYIVDFLGLPKRDEFMDGALLDDIKSSLAQVELNYDEGVVGGGIESDREKAQTLHELVRFKVRPEQDNKRSKQAFDSELFEKYLQRNDNRMIDELSSYQKRERNRNALARKKEAEERGPFAVSLAVPNLRVVASSMARAHVPKHVPEHSSGQQHALGGIFDMDENQAHAPGVPFRNYMPHLVTAKGTLMDCTVTYWHARVLRYWYCLRGITRHLPAMRNWICRARQRLVFRAMDAVVESVEDLLHYAYAAQGVTGWNSISRAQLERIVQCIVRLTRRNAQLLIDEWTRDIFKSERRFVGFKNIYENEPMDFIERIGRYNMHNPKAIPGFVPESYTLRTLKWPEMVSLSTLDGIASRLQDLNRKLRFRLQTGVIRPTPPPRRKSGMVVWSSKVEPPPAPRETKTTFPR